MEEAQEILLNSLENSGISIPPGVSSIQDLTSPSLFSICSQSLRIMDDVPSSFPTSLPESMTDRFKICTEMAEAIENLGYIGDINFHKFLYPSEEDLYKLVRFLIEKLSETTESRKIDGEKNVNARIKLKEDDNKSTSKVWTEKADTQVDDLYYQKVGDTLKDLRLKTEEVPESSGTKEELASLEAHKESLEDPRVSRTEESGNEETVSELGQKRSSLREQSSQIRCKIENLQNKEKVLMDEVTENNSKLQHIEEEHELLKAAVEMAFDDQHPVDFYIEQLNAQVDAKRCNLVEMESQWDASKKALEEKKGSLEESLYATKPEVWDKYQKLKEVKLETQSILSEIRKREEEHSKLSAELANQPKAPTRRSYIQRVTEITKNSRKQDADIERILKETRELQLESNSIQESLHRTYAVVDETVFREAKKDPVGKQAYKLLTSIHESFEQISEKILATDRVRREAAFHEAKLAAMASRSLNIDKLQADLDAIKKDNEQLERQHHEEK